MRTRATCISSAVAPAAMPWAQRLVLCTLAAAVLSAGFSGHAGVQVLDRAMAARLFPLHLHGVPGEATYVHTHGGPAPFVPAHCHAPISDRDGGRPPGPDEVQAASVLGGALSCVTQTMSLILAASVGVAVTPDSRPTPTGADVPVLTEPPR